LVSKTKMLEIVKALRWKEVAAVLDDDARLLAYQDDKGRNWLHICCGVNIKGDKRKAADSIRTAEALLERGLPINREAFIAEGQWKATPLWYAIARGENLALAEYLLQHGSNPNYCLWAAAFREDLAAIRMLARAGADLNDPSVDFESPLLHAIKWSHFKAAAELLKLGADPNYQDPKGMTALHYMLNKASDKKHFAMLIAHGARGNLKNNDGVTAADLMRRKKDPEFRAMAERLT
jgi:uncharacterized protein